MAKSFRDRITSRWTFSKFTLSSLPLAFFTGLRVTRIDDTSASVTVRHNYINKNPFKSLYFGSQAMAAELSTGVMVLERVDKADHPVSMLVGGMKATFTKKATGLITFTCSDGQLLDAAFSEVLTSDAGQAITMTTIGTDEKGDVVSAFEFEWSVRKRRSRK